MSQIYWKICGNYYFNILCSLCITTYFTLCLQKHSKKFRLHQIAKDIRAIVCAKKQCSAKAAGCIQRTSQDQTQNKKSWNLAPL